ncbi:MAG: hypothetical protein Kow00109_04240 [Acidobacteriota bacterium]
MRILTALLIAVILSPAPPPAAPAVSEEFPLLLETGENLEFPFAEGETLEFEVNWKPIFLFPAFRAGRIRLTITPAEYRGRPTFRLQGWAESEGMLSRVAGMEVRDYFESHVDRRTFRSYWNLQQLREGRRQRDLELTFDYDQNCWWVRETDPAQDPPRVLRNVRRVGIPSPVVDVLSAFYVPRLARFQPGTGFAVDVNESGAFRRIRVRIEAEETVETPLGRFASLRMATVGGAFRIGGDLRVWYTKDPPRFPVKFETEVKFGRVYGTVVRLATPQATRRILRVP